MPTPNLKEVGVELIVVLVVLAVLAVPIGLIVVSVRAAAIPRIERDLQGLRLDVDGFRARLAGVEAMLHGNANARAAGPYRMVGAPPQLAMTAAPSPAPVSAFPKPSEPLSPPVEAPARPMSVPMPVSPIRAVVAPDAPEAKPADPIDAVDDRLRKLEAAAAAARVRAATNPEPEPERLPVTRFEWERWLGVRGAAALGAVVLVIAGLYFFKYSIDRGVLTPPIRVLLGAIAGLGCIGAGEKFVRSRHSVLASWLAGAGVALLYATTWAARSLYDLASAEVAFGLMIAITIGCTALAIKRRALAIALLGLLGGFATPLILTSSGQRPFALFAYLFVLDGALVAVAVRRRWPVLALLSLAGTTLYEALWIPAHAASTGPIAGMIILIVFAGAFLFAPRARAENEDAAALDKITVAGALIAPMLFGFVFAADAALVPHVGLIALFLAVLDVAAIVVARRQDRPVLALAAVGATAAVLAVWLAQRTSLAGMEWELAGSVVGLAAIFHLATEIDRRRGDVAVARFAPAVAASLAGAAILTAAPSDGWIASLAGTLALVALGLRQAALRRCAPVAIGVAIVLGVAVPVASLHAPATVAPALLALLALAPLGMTFVARAIRDGMDRANDRDDRDDREDREDDREDREDDRENDRAWILRAAATLAALGAIGALVVGRASGPLGIGAAEIALAVTGLWVANRLALAPLALVNGGLSAGALAAYALDRDRWAPGAAGAELTIVILASAAVAAAWPFLSKTARANATSFRIAALALPLHAVALALAWRLGPFDPKAVPAVVAVGSFLAFALARRLELGAETRRVALDWLFSVGGLALTLFFGVALQGAARSGAFAVEGIALLALAARLDRTEIRAAGLVLLAGSALPALDARLLEAQTRAGMPFLNELAPAFVIPAVALGVAWLMLRRSIPQASAACATAALLLAFAWSNVAVLDAFGAGGTIGDELGRLPLAISVAWIVFAIGLLALGMRLASAHLRWASLALVLAASLKLFLVDLAYLRDLARVASLVGLAVSLITVSALYQRFVLRIDRRANAA